MTVESNTVREHDTDLIVWYADPKDPAVKATRDAIVRKLRDRGFKMGPDPRIVKDYPVLKQYHHVGRLGDLQVHVELAGRSVKVEFFQDVVCENRAGGRYDFRKRDRMPYLIGKRYEVEREKLFQLCEARGLTVIRARRPLLGMDFVNQRRAECWHWQGGKLLERIYDYNSKMADGGQVHEGDTVYFADYWAGRRIVRGVARYNLNNMWWVVLPSGEVRNIASFELYRREGLPADLRGRHIDKRRVDKRLAELKDAAVKAEQYERAAVLRDLLRQREAA